MSALSLLIGLGVFIGAFVACALVYWFIGEVVEKHKDHCEEHDKLDNRIVAVNTRCYEIEKRVDELEKKKEAV